MMDEQLFQTALVILAVLALILARVKLNKLKREMVEIYTAFEMEVHRVSQLEERETELELEIDLLVEDMYKANLAFLQAGPDM